MKELRFYRTENGKEPFRSWIESLKDFIALTQVRRLALGQRGDYKRVGKGVFELRIHFGPGYRIYFSEHGKEVILLFSGGDKSSQKRDIKQAITYWQDYKKQFQKQKSEKTWTK